MKEENIIGIYFMLWILAFVIIIGIIAIILIAQDNSYNMKIKCIQQNQTYIKYSDNGNGIGIEYCGDLNRILGEKETQEKTE
jgi:hypothetical protein